MSLRLLERSRKTSCGNEPDHPRRWGLLTDQTLLMTRLKRLDAYLVRVPLPQPLLLAHQTIADRDYAIVEAETDDGATGRAIGYARGAPVDAVVTHMLAPAWLGADLAAYAELYDRTVRANVMQGTHGIFWRALSLADIAVHDALARRDSVPLAALLGGVPREVPTTLAGCYPLAGETDESLRALLKAMAALPSVGIKITGSGDYSHDTHRLSVCRKVLGGSPPLIIDLYGSVSDVNALIPHARGWAEYGVGWLEDPCTFDALDSLAQLADALPYPVGVGDEQAGLEHFDNLVRYGKIRVVRLDATTCGGITGFLRISRRARARGLPVSCHVFHHLHAQLASAMDGISIEYMLPATGVDAIDSLIKEDLSWGGTGLVASNMPGTGMAWDERALAAHRVARA